MANFRSLPLELRQQILFEAFKQADEQDNQYQLLRLTKLAHEHNITRLIRQHAQARLCEDPSDVENYFRVRPLGCAPAVDRLIVRQSERRTRP